MNRNAYRIVVSPPRRGKPMRTRPMTPAELAEHQLRRIVALGAAVRETAWEAAQLRLANLRHQKRVHEELAQLADLNHLENADA